MFETLGSLEHLENLSLDIFKSEVFIKFLQIELLSMLMLK